MKRNRLSQEKNTQNYNPQISASVSLPEFEQFPKISSFYKKVSQKCRDFSLCALPRAYPDKNLFYCVRATCDQKDGILTVKLRVTLSDRRAMRLLFSDDQTHVWRQKDQLLIKVIRKQKSKSK